MNNTKIKFISYFIISLKKPLEIDICKSRANAQQDKCCEPSIYSIDVEKIVQEQLSRKRQSCPSVCYLSIARELTSGGGGGYFKKIMMGVCGPNLEDTPYSYKGQA